MAWRIVRQPDGLLAAFSEVVDNFTMYGATQDEAIRFCVDHHGMSLQDATKKVQSGIDDIELWTVDTKGPGLSRWDDALGTIVFRHGEQALRERLSEMGFEDYPVDGIIEENARTDKGPKA